MSPVRSLLPTPAVCDATDILVSPPTCAGASAAVPSSCKTLADAKNLPPAVFTCDKKPQRPLLRLSRFRHRQQ